MSFYKKYDKSVFKKLPNIDYDEMFGYNGEFDTDDSISSVNRNDSRPSLHNAVQYIRFHGVANDSDSENDDDSESEIVYNTSNFVINNDTEDDGL